MIKDTLFLVLGFVAGGMFPRPQWLKNLIVKYKYRTKN